MSPTGKPVVTYHDAINLLVLWSDFDGNEDFKNMELDEIGAGVFWVDFVEGLFSVPQERILADVRTKLVEKFEERK